MSRLRGLLAEGKTIVAPGATDALSAKLIEAHGFDCVYIGSYATAASRFGIPDTGLLSLEALVEQARTIVQAVKLPVIADAEGGFHGAGDIWRTVQAFERAGVAAIHLEDHTGAGKHTSAPQTLHPMGANGKAARGRDDGLEELFPELPKHYRIAAGNLSGGQRQMLAFACALAGRPKLLILDEPSAGLSPILTREVFERVERVNRSGVSILMIEQNAIEALRISQSCVVLNGGRVRACASAREVLGMKDLNSIYLGDASNRV